MTKTEIERLAVVESQIEDVRSDVGEVKESQTRIEQKLDAAIECKADRSEVAAITDALKTKASAEEFKELRQLLIRILVSVAGFGLITLVYIIAKAAGVEF